MPKVSSCPAPDTLADFALGRLSESEASILREHLADCVVCSRAVRGLQNSPTVPLNGEPPPTRLSSGQFPFLAPPLQADELGLLGPYRILKLLGEGGMGMVFQAKDTTLDRLVALKVMKPETSTHEVSRKRFLQEACAAASIQHDHIVTIYHVGEDNGVPYLAMQFLRGESLDSRLRRVGRLPVAEILRIGREVAEGLTAAHAQGMIHRDIKPANIWLEDLGPDIPNRVKILDFGLARVSSDGSQHLTRTGVVMGTPGYMAPEQARGQGGVGSRCDLFSLGCVLYHMSTGQEPFRGEDVMAILMALALEEPLPVRVSNPEVPDSLADLVKKLMAKNPDERPPSAAAVSKTLAAIERSSQSVIATLQNGPVPTPTTGGTLAPSLPAEDVRDNQLVSTLESAAPDTLDAPILEAPIDSPFGHCPRCGTPWTTAAAKKWCLNCGFFPEKEEAQVPVVRPSAGFPKWCWYLLAGMLVIVLISIAGDLCLPKRSAARAWWGTTQLGLGVLVIIFADIMAFLHVLPTGTQVSFVEMLFPFKMWVSAFELLPKTRHPVCLLGWGLSIMLCAVLLVGGQLWWFSKHKPIQIAAAAATKEKEEPDDDDDLDNAAPEPTAPSAETPEQNDDLTGLDSDDDTDMDKDSSRPFKSQYVVIGYIPADDQGAAGIVVASPSEGKLQNVQTILFAAGQAARTEASRQLSRLKVLADPPAEAGTVKAIWVEPKQSCWIGYNSIDENGALQDPVFKKWEMPKKPAEPK